jgi:hypothetical protein
MCLLQFHILQTQSYANNILDIIDCLGHTDYMRFWDVD